MTWTQFEDQETTQGWYWVRYRVFGKYEYQVVEIDLNRYEGFIVYEAGLDQAVPIDEAIDDMGWEFYGPLTQPD